MKIDIVYTWVNGTDPQWQERKEKRLKELGIPVQRTANHSCRFIEHDELRYSLRSIYSFAPWINKIYVVTDNQVPTWFNADNSWVSIISHTELFDDKTCLPTFNSMAIESQIHKIKGLSEYYIYLNDDFFMGRPCTVNDFVSKDGKPYIFVEEYKTFTRKKSILETDAINRSKNEYQAGLANSRLLVNNKYGKTCKYTLSHVYRVLQKSVMTKLHDEFLTSFTTTAKHPFRSFDDILGYAIYNYYMCINRFGIAKKTPELRSRKYVLQNLVNRYNRFLYKYVDIDSRRLQKALENIKKYKHFMFCLNDGHDTTDEDYEKVQQFLKEFFPDKSPAEK